MQPVVRAGFVPHIPGMDNPSHDKDEPQPAAPAGNVQPSASEPREIGGPKGAEPTRHGDWEYNGRCTDF
jgi:hypothetical protein